MNEREWIQYPKDIPVETKFGTIFLAVTDGQRLALDEPEFFRQFEAK